MKCIQWQKVIICVLLVGIVFKVGCNGNKKTVNSNQPNLVEKPVVTPSVTPFPISPNEPVLFSDEKTDKNYHESEYRSKLKIISVLNELTKLDSIYVSKFPPDDEFEKRKKKIFKLVDGLDDDADDLITLAEMCQIMTTHGVHGISQVTSSFDIAFYYSIKVVGTKHKNDERIIKELIQWMKKNIFGGHTAADFLLSLDGKEPRYLYGEEPTPEEFEYLEKQFEFLEKQSLE